MEAKLTIKRRGMATNREIYSLSRQSQPQVQRALSFGTCRGDSLSDSTPMVTMDLSQIVAQHRARVASFHDLLAYLGLLVSLTIPIHLPQDAHHDIRTLSDQCAEVSLPVTKPGY
jgi:hypothetical protein